MSRNEAILDIVAVIGVCTAYVLLEALDVPKRWTFLAMAFALAAYAAYFVRRRSDSWHALGFRTDNLRAGLLPIAIVTFVGAVGLIAFGLREGRVAWGRQALLLLALYPAWALAQQFAFQAVLHRRLMMLGGPRILQILVTATAFASVHFGNRVLLVLTFVAGVVWSAFYRRWPNLWLLAGSHSILAALAYPLVLGDAPLSRL